MESKEITLQWVSSVFDSAIIDFRILGLLSAPETQKTVQKICVAGHPDIGDVINDFATVQDEYERFFREIPYSEENNKRALELKLRVVDAMRKVLRLIRERGLLSMLPHLSNVHSQ
eukprot:488929_1